MKTQRKTFINCNIDFSKKVFQPRIETEFWVEKAVEVIKKQEVKNKAFDVLDIFAGTGCIGIFILKSLKSAKVDFVDIWPKAIEQIKINLDFNKIKKDRYKIYKSNLFGELKKKNYDFVFANPPYVALDRISEVSQEVLKNDPLAALFSGKDGTVMIEKFFSQVKNYLKPNGKIFLEFDPSQSQKIEKMAEKEGFKVSFRKDQFNKIRWLKATIQS
jgi:release factor glutamine methyltransferase